MANRMMSPILLRIDAPEQDRNKRHADSIPFACTARSPVFSLPASGGGAVFHTASSTPSNCINTNESPASARRFYKRLRPPPGADRCCLTAHIYRSQPVSHTPRSPADRPALSVPRRKAAKCLSLPVRSSIQRFSCLRTDPYRPAPAKQKVQFILHRAVISSKVQQVSVCACTDRSPPGAI